MNFNFYICVCKYFFQNIVICRDNEINLTRYEGKLPLNHFKYHANILLDTEEHHTELQVRLSPLQALNPGLLEDETEISHFLLTN